MSRLSFRGKKQIMTREGSAKSNQNITLKELHAIFITAKRAEGLRDSTLKEHISHFQYFIAWLENKEHTSFLNCEPDITTIRAYIEFMKTGLKISPVTINTRLRTLRCFLKFLADEDYFQENLAFKIKLMKTDKDSLKLMNTEQIQALLKVIDTKCYTGYRDYCLLMLLLDTGIRIQEATALTSDYLDFQASTIYLQASNAKNRTGRLIPLSPKVNKLLFNLVQENKKAFNAKELFLSVYGTPFLKTSFRKRLVFYRDKAEIKGCRVSPHSFRHYFAKNYILNGGDPFTLQRILGHADLQMVRKYINMGEGETKIQHNQFSPVQRFKF